MLLIKSLLKAVTPPFLIQTFRHFFIKKPPLIWTGDYKSWDEAKSNCTGYGSDSILEKCKNALLKVKNGEAIYERDGVLFDEVQYSCGLLAVLQRAALENEGNLCVLDFGGSLGSTFFQNKEFLCPINDLQWCIVEQKNFVDCGKESFESEQLKFYYSIEECLAEHKPNVLLLSGVLQYLEKPYQWIHKFINLNIPYIIVDRTSLIEEGRDILTLQNVPEGIYNASYPAWFFCKKKFVDCFKNKYTEILKFDSFCDPNIDLNHNISAKWGGFSYFRNL